MNNFGDNVHAVGSFELLARFWRTPTMLKGLPLDAGALTCPMAASALARLPQNFSPATMTFESLQLGGHPIIDMTLSVGDLEIHWLADAKDPDVWMYTSFWKEWKAMPIVVGVEQGTDWVYRFYLSEMPNIALTPGERVDTHYVWGDMVPWLSMVQHIKNHRAAYPLLSARVPPLPRPDGFRAKVGLFPADI
ncbi:hypothetical protein [Burkholderia sp. S-53]|uniref:hypothetical protein n=1 Tax=Burkholderia sp. S-53 TaxID=2906514 RepID=UPI0021D1B70D|nr:hypothetical protein [Burkholderia sp. S-53]UXU92088.1 hypothetical protein LXM88_28490 [Burkholderia sp. S-53]